MTLLVKHCT